MARLESGRIVRLYLRGKCRLCLISYAADFAKQLVNHANIPDNTTVVRGTVEITVFGRHEPAVGHVPAPFSSGKV